MQVATTLQFRKAVRKYAEKKGLSIGESWTNKTTVSGDCGDRRTVGFYIPSATEKTAAKIEKKLNKKGLTAQTRYTDSYNNSMCYGGGTYIRGTCVLAD
jgi:S-formylglutathione hydrolase FrmB